MKNLITKLIINGSLASLLTLLSAQVVAETAKIAVAANFTKTIEKVGEAFTQKTGHKVKFSFGPTGKLYAQIKMGAPYDAFFGADEFRPLKTIEDGLAVDNSYFVYAEGQLVIYSSKPEKLPVNPQALQTLQQANFRRLAIANPKTAPYGERAKVYLQQQGLLPKLKSKLVYGESVGNAFQYVATGNAEIGFIALSQVVDPQSPLFEKGAYWQIPQQDYQPIKQGAVMLKRGQKNPAAKEFMAFIKTQAATEIIKRYGYEAPKNLME